MDVQQAIKTLQDAGYLVKLFNRDLLRAETEQRGNFTCEELEDITTYAEASDHWFRLLDGISWEATLIALAVDEGIESFTTLKD